jgi:two-component system, OmpR family, alkaline phosphatase synthesis response regulator PhoP
MKEQILVVDDEDDIRELLELTLRREGYRVVCAASGEEALDAIRAQQVDLAVIDLMLPGIDGLDVCRSLKGNGNGTDCGVIILTAKGEEADIVAGLEIGADDYVTKPFSSRVFLARVKSVVRRRRVAVPGADQTLQHSELSLCPGRREVKIGERKIDLTATEFGVLHLLLRRPGWVFTRSQIVDQVKGTDYAVTERAVDVQIVGLRKKLGDHGHLIETVRGVGYRARD